MAKTTRTLNFHRKLKCQAMAKTAHAINFFCGNDSENDLDSDIEGNIKTK